VVISKDTWIREAQAKACHSWGHGLNSIHRTHSHVESAPLTILTTTITPPPPNRLGVQARVGTALGH